MTRRALEILNRHDVPWTVLTKGGRLALRDMDLFQQAGPKCSFGTSLSFMAEIMKMVWEPYAATVMDRTTTLMYMRGHDVRTWVSLEPVIDPGQAVRVVNRCSGFVDEFRVGKLNHHPHASTIDWADFTHRIVGALLDTDCDYVIKADLRQYLPEGVPAERRREA
jgi:hypothetical protein